jgi:hypothetical protein
MKEREDVKAREKRRLEKRKAEKARTSCSSDILLNRISVITGIQLF